MKKCVYFFIVVCFSLSVRSQCDTLIAAYSSDRRWDTLFFSDKSTGNIVKWKWDFDDGSYDSVQNPFHVFTTGVYEVILTVTDTCMDSAIIIIEFKFLPIGISNYGYNNFIKIFPNPNNGSFTLQNSSNQEGYIRISNLQGQEVFLSELDSAPRHFITTKLGPGLYIATVYQQKAVFTTRFIIK